MNKHAAILFLSMSTLDRKCLIDKAIFNFKRLPHLIFLSAAGCQIKINIFTKIVSITFNDSMPTIDTINALTLLHWLETNKIDYHSHCSTSIDIDLGDFLVIFGGMKLNTI